MKRYLVLVGLLAVLGCSKPSRVALEGEPVAAAQPPAEQEARPEAKAEPRPEPVATDVGTFSFGDDAAGRLLAKKLTPGNAGRLPPDKKSAPRQRAGVRALEQPDLPLERPAPRLPNLPITPRSPLRPHALADGAPLDFYRGDIAPPGRPELPPAALLRIPAPDVHEPVPLVTQAKPAADRASLEDPTAEFSSARMVAERARLRSTPAPFQRYNLPDVPEAHNGAGLPTTEPPVVAPVPQLPK